MPHELARISYSIERDDLGISGGWQDQYAAAFGGFNLFEFSRQGVLVSPIRAAAETLARLQERLMLCYTGFVRRNVGLIDTQIDLYREGREDTILGMKQLHAIAYAMRDAVEEGDVDELGAMLHDAFVAKRRMNPAHRRAHPDRGHAVDGAGGRGERRQDLRRGRWRISLAVLPPLGAAGRARGAGTVWADSSRSSRSARTASARTAATTVWAPTRGPGGEPA